MTVISFRSLVYIRQSEIHGDERKSLLEILNLGSGLVDGCERVLLEVVMLESGIFNCLLDILMLGSAKGASAALTLASQ